MTTKHIRPYKFTVALFLALVTTLGFVVDNTRVFALDVPFYSGNDILFWNPDAADCTTGGGDGTLRGESTKEKIWNYLLDKGLSAEQAAGVMGNMDAESGFVVTRRQNNNTKDIWNSNGTDATAWGLAQWDGGRRYSPPKGGVLGKLREKQPDLEKYVAPEFGGAEGDKKIPEEDLDALLLFELNFLYDESTSREVKEHRYGTGKNEWETLKLTKTVDDATVYWHNNFEVSDDSPETVLNGRGGKSQAVFKELSGGTRAGAVSSGKNCATAGGAKGNLAELVVKYAWPEYHPKGYVQRMPDYIDAIDKAKKEGRYIGDTCHGGGVDCGAWVTTIINNSGFDPAYNHNGKMKDGAGYTVVQKAWAEKNWQNLGNGSSINVADLKPGDVAHLDGHTFMFAGKGIKFKVIENGVEKEKEFGGGDSAFKGVASASQCGRAPMAGHESMTSSEVTWYRKK